MQPLHRLFGKELTNLIDDRLSLQPNLNSNLPQITRQQRGLSQQ